MNRIKLSKNFYLDEFTLSQKAVRAGILIEVTQENIEFFYIKMLCEKVLQPLRDALGPVHITSGYRPPKLNKLIGGSSRSQHMYGQAADVVVSGYTPLQVARWIAKNISGYDQLIHEFGAWTHVSVPGLHSHPRRQRLTAYKKKSRIPGLRPKTVYVPGLVAIDDLPEVA